FSTVKTTYAKIAATDVGKALISLVPDKWKANLDTAVAQFRQIQTQLKPLAPHAVALKVAIHRYLAATDEAGRRAELKQVLAAGLGLLEQTIKLDTGLDDKASEAIGKGFRVARAVLAGDYVLGISSIFELLLLVPNSDSEAYKNIKRFGTLFADVAGAQSGDEVAAALESAASPAGSWRLRRKKRTWGLSAHVGFGGGVEHLTSGAHPDGGTLGLAAPVLLDGYLDWKWPVGAGVQLIDLGSVASVGFQKDVQTKPDLGLAEILAIGPSISVGLGDSPFLISFSASWTPALRKQIDMGAPADVYRYLLTLSVDVPIFLF
ncbi:MAG TPA: hypothetical protein VHN14_24520, partial [Kofleriaceae bacterium]|nr:hypothetical protein [Kofleriaceae bacterium]